ncbi:MAG TPA: trypsin-like peptidase domain-containing protein [Blastocatellia bacterium]|jgi:S1-C subfamily serine protease|nr:trypsin-like peptidase domain-containing protein [Blastocatellia bacterium]
MERIILRHISGSKAGQVEEFPLNHFKELTLGRDPSVTVKYDPDRDDLVGRVHAKIVQDPSNPSRFTISDLNSRNGTFVNRQRLVGASQLSPGDTVQFGAGGPELQFDLDPRPQPMKATRVGDSGTAGLGSTPAAPSGPPPTRTGPGMPPSPSQPYQPQGYNIPPTQASSGHGNVGKATVERMIAQNKNSSMKYIILGGVVLLVVIAAVAAGLLYQQFASNKQIASDTSRALEEAKAGAPMSAAEIVKNFTNSAVYIEVGWKLIYTPTGGQVYHMYIPNNFKGKPIVPDGRSSVATYVMVSQDTIEPYLTTDSRSGRPIGGEHTGSGFTVTSDGFILTNRHVAATWKTSYQFPDDSTPGVVIQGGTLALGQDGNPILIRAPQNWVPSGTMQAGQKLQGGFEGRNDYLDVTFAKNDLRIPAKLVRTSDRHDVAMIKIDTPESVNKVELYDNYDVIKPGDGAIVLGYPAVSPPVYGVTKSQDVFNRESKIKIVPDPTVSVGNVGRVIRGSDGTASGKDPIYSAFGDAYQLTINSTGSGNSGGPVFDDRGRVTGIFFASSRSDAMITFAVPIRYGKELMSVGTSR